MFIPRAEWTILSMSRSLDCRFGLFEVAGSLRPFCCNDDPLLRRTILSQLRHKDSMKYVSGMFRVRGREIGIVLNGLKGLDLRPRVTLR